MKRRKKMQEIKFRYVLQDPETGETVSKVFTLQEIEEHDLDWIYEQFELEFGGGCDCYETCECSPVFDEWKIISRDLCTGLKDKKDVEIYDNDTISMFNNTQTSTIIFKDGCFMNMIQLSGCGKPHFDILCNHLPVIEVIGNKYNSLNPINENKS